MAVTKRRNCIKIRLNLYYYYNSWVRAFTYRTSSSSMTSSVSDILRWMESYQPIYKDIRVADHITSIHIVCYGHLYWPLVWHKSFTESSITNNSLYQSITNKLLFQEVIHFNGMGTSRNHIWKKTALWFSRALLYSSIVLISLRLMAIKAKTIQMSLALAKK